MFLPHFDVFCDLLLNRLTATWNLFVTGLPNPVGISVSFRGFFTGLPMGKPSRGLRLVCLFSFYWVAVYGNPSWKMGRISPFYFFPCR